MVQNGELRKNPMQARASDFLTKGAKAIHFLKNGLKKQLAKLAIHP